MTVLVVDNCILYKHGNDYFAQSIYSYEFLQRYLTVFDKVKFIAKVDCRYQNDYSKMQKVNGENVYILELPYYRGMSQLIQKLPLLFRIFRKASENCECIIYRIAQIESFFVYFLDKHSNKPFAVEVVNDPATFVDMSWWVRFISVKMVKHMTWRANGASYVTERYLQALYPNEWIIDQKNHFVSSYSSVDLRRNEIASEAIVYKRGEELKIVHVSNAINSDVKGHYTLIKAVNEVLKSNGLVRLIIIGDGDKLNEYRQYVNKIGITEKVEFLGRIHSKSELLKVLKETNLMVLPTKMEGLPRTIIEAMSVGLPVISSPTAGIPELLETKYLFNPDDYMGFASEILHLLDNPTELEEMSKKNIKVAQNYESSILQQRRFDFYRKLYEKVQRLND